MKNLINKLFRALSSTKRPLEKHQEVSSLTLIDQARRDVKPSYNSSSDLKEFITRWNAMYPIDRWWREKYRIPLNSPEHSRAVVLDMKLDWEEDLLYRQVKTEIGTQSKTKYVPGRGAWLKKREIEKPTDDQVNDMFDGLDLSRIEGGEDSSEIIV